MFQIDVIHTHAAEKGRRRLYNSLMKKNKTNLLVTGMVIAVGGFIAWAVAINVNGTEGQTAGVLSAISSIFQ